MNLRHALPAALLSLLPALAPAADAPAGAVDVDRVMRVAARKLAAFDASRADKSGYPTEAKGAAGVTVPPSGMCPVGGRPWQEPQAAWLASVQFGALATVPDTPPNEKLPWQ